VTALLPAILTSDTSCQLGRRLMLTLQSGDIASDDPLSSFCIEAVTQVSGEALSLYWIRLLILMMLQLLSACSLARSLRSFKREIEGTHHFSR